MALVHRVAPLDAIAIPATTIAIRMAIVDVAHEALIRHWKLLCTWIEENRDLLRKQRKIEASAIAWREQGKRRGDLLLALSLDEAIQFNQKQAGSFPLSDSAKLFVQQRRKKSFMDRLKISSWLLIPALIVTGVVEYNLREASIKQDFARLDQEGTYEEKRAVQDLVQGCSHQELPRYFSDRLYGNCRSLSQTPLQKADLRAADLRSADLRAADLSDADFSDADLRAANLRYADLRSADLRSADLRSADLLNADLRAADLSDADLRAAYLSDADLRSADLSDADLSDANLRSADLRSADLLNADLRSADLRAADLSDANLLNADLHSAIFITTDLRKTKGLTEQQIQSGNIHLCNSPLPGQLNIDRNRNCDQIASILLKRYRGWFENLEEAQQYVNKQRQQTWD